jgi:preprotein translocase subunit SecA
MFSSLVKKVFGSKNSRELKRIGKIVAQINEFESSLADLDDEALRAKTPELKEKLAAGQTLTQILPEAFAVVREAGKRVMKMRHFDVQMIGGIVLHEGKIAEMRTGEGKTLVATLPVYLNALSGKGVHVVTVNDYLAQRDANWMKPLYNFLGLSVGVAIAGMDQDAKKAAYQADITYGTNNEFGFDYLRDNMAFSIDDKVQRELNFAIVDEVDSILIDEARTPLIISGAVEDSSKLYRNINTIPPLLKRAEVDEQDNLVVDGHYTVDEKNRSVELTESGHAYIEELLTERGLLEEGDSLYSAMNLGLLHHVNSALKAHTLFTKDIDYIVQSDEIVIVDEHTGRTMPGRRWGEGIHQAIEAKEGVNVQAESQTLASTTFQNYFRLYNTLSGMTGTADTEAFEFRQIYGLDVVVIPTNKPVLRNDANDLVFMTQEEKYQAIIDEIKDVKAEKRPILVGTASIESSEYLSTLLTKSGIKHSVLNAKHHEQEAHIIAEAGQPGTVTLATNMAGRGTDIVLGGNLDVELAALQNPSEEEVEALKADWKVRHETVLNAGGLHIIGTERHESRRIDNQLRGRAGRQGDPGSTRFFLSLEDNLMRIFASDRVKNIMQALGMEKGEAIEHRMVSNAIEKAQRKVEGRNFDMRKSLLEYDDVANDQRRVVYDLRNDIMATDDISENIAASRRDVLVQAVYSFIPPQSLEEQWDVPGLERHLSTEFGVEVPVQKWLDEDQTLHEEVLTDKILEEVVKAYATKETVVGVDVMRNFEKQVFLQILDTLWKEHLSAMDNLRRGIHLRGYAQKDPKQEYKRESFELFRVMLDQLKEDVIRVVCNVQVQSQEEIDEIERQRRDALQKQLSGSQAVHTESSAMSDSDIDESQEPTAEPFVRTEKKVGRNEPCPCGSGKKYKQCHGKMA